MSDIAAAGVTETHSAVVFFFGERAYKVKKPVDLGFLDFRTVESRRLACHEEVRLNRRIAPDVYLGVADVLGVDGEVCDHLVVMQRMPDERRLAALVRRGEDVSGVLHDVAHQLATLHARSVRSVAADEAAGLDATRARWVANTEGLLAQAERGVFDALSVATTHGLAARYLDGRAPLFAARVAAGRAVDGHGDLLADDIFDLPDGPRVLDCLDFDVRLRLGDGLADAAFLAMDLERLEHPHLSRAFLASYAEHADDTWPPSLAHHHIAYRAEVRAKVAAVRSAQGDPDAAEAARSLLALSRSHLEEGRIRLILVGGLPGTGKSLIATAVADRLEATHIRSDEVRKELAGIPASTPAGAEYGEDLYRPEAKRRTYETMLDRAGIALSRGYSVVLDASWSRQEWRDRARALATTAVADLAELRCTAPADIAAERLRRRASVGRDPSDATPEVATAMTSDWESWPSATTIDNSGLSHHAVDAAMSALGRSPHRQRIGTRHDKSAPEG